ncbi:neither inactivation nor afterpotential B [Carabus blaptoides fortunei]
MESIFNWSPLSQRKLCTNKTSVTKTDQGDLYPNCDVNIWLRSCEKEIIDPIQGKVTGSIPTWLNGCLLRNGPGSLKVGKMEFKHLFDSSALLHRFAINNGNVTYQCRFLQSEVYKKNNAAQRIVVTEFGTASVPDPCQTIFRKIAASFDPNNESDNAMISVYPFGDEIYAFTETPFIHRINKLTLENEQRLDISKYVTIINHTSHPHVTSDGTVYNLGMSITKCGLTHNIIRFPEKALEDSDELSIFKQAQIVATVPARWILNPSYMHTFGITDNYFVIVEQPFSINALSVLKNKIFNEPMAKNFRWYQDEMTQIHIISKKTGFTAYKFYSEPFFYLHIINQYEISDHIVLDICCYRDPSMLDCMYVEAMKHVQSNPDYAKMFRGRPFRFILPLKVQNNTANENLITLPNTDAQAYFLSNGKIFVRPEQLCDLGCETPRIYYEKHLAKEYRYFYAISSDVDCSNPGSIIKVDINNKKAITWNETNCYPSEPIFVPNPDCKFEDDGIILSAMIWGREETNKVGLLVLDARTFVELGRAVFETAGPVPKCLHGWFASSQ